MNLVESLVHLDYIFVGQFMVRINPISVVSHRRPVCENTFDHPKYIPETYSQYMKEPLQASCLKFETKSAQ